MYTTQHTQRPACPRSGLVVAVLLLLFSKTTMAATPTPPQDSAQRIFTVAKVYMEKYSEPGTVQVTFYESARFYKIEKTNPKYKEYVALLKEAIKKQKPVRVTLKTRDSDIILEVKRE